MESLFINAVVVIATGAAVIRFALYEWEGIMQAWIRITRLGKRHRQEGHG